jgi:hypothetical protein
VTAIGQVNVSRVTVDRAIELAVATGVAVLVVIGFVTSYETLRSLAITDGGFAPWLAPAVPLSFDLGIVVLSLKIVAAARQGRHALVHRALVAVLSTATVAVNSTASNGTAGQLLHAIPPAMFVICFEGLIADARRSALAGRRPMAGRWKAGLLAPITTMRTWREDALRSTSAAVAAASAKRPTRTHHRTRPARALSGPRVEALTRLNPGRPDDRLALAREALRDQPHLTAPALARALRDHGHEVSVRTAQRLKSRLSEDTV